MIVFSRTQVGNSHVSYTKPADYVKDANLVLYCLQFILYIYTELGFDVQKSGLGCSLPAGTIVGLFSCSQTT